MAERPFVHLHCHSHYSLLDGASRIPELVARVKELGMNAIALTDHGNLYGAIEFYRECRAAGLNPIIGYEAYVAPNKRTDREPRRAGTQSDDALYHHLTLLAKDRTGFRNLIKMASLAFLEGYHYGKPRIDKELLEQFNEGIICLSGCAAAEFSDYILRNRLDEARKLAEWFARLFKDRFYIEIQNNGLDIQRICAEGAIDIANQLGLPLVATSDAHYLRQEDHIAHDVLLCINTGKTRSNPNRFKFAGDQFHVRPPEDMYRLFPDHADAVRRSQEIADSVHIELDFKQRHFPVFTPPDRKKPEEYLRELCEQGARDRYGDPLPPEVVQRLEHELSIICRMGFASYFLIVWDFVRFARERGIPASARGSACGALVSYVLKLSHVDPLEYDLLFERFLDPNRSEAPDIDIDFCQDRREEVIAYVKQKYGEESVAQIGTFGTLAAKAAIKDVGRALDVPLERVNQLTALIPKTLGITLDESLRQVPELRQAYETDPQVRELIDIARKLEGTNRNAGTHAAGVVIANGPLIDYVPVQRVVRKGEPGRAAGAEDEESEAAGAAKARAGGLREAVVTTQWEMGDLEKVGMLKMDFLGLRTLTLLDTAVRLIEQTRGEKIDLYRLPLDDAETYALLQRGDAKGVFQFEKEGIRELLKRLKPDNIRDLIACNALYRPGPLGGGMVDAYVNRKHGREKPAYPHPVMKEILTETFGILVYQEQCMQILNRLGGIELASAYACIKAISKKKQDVIDARRVDFMKGAQERGVPEEVAREVFDQILYFGGYGFNKSHSAAYALVGYQTAYLKAHYTPEFMAALLSSEIEDGNKRDIMVEHIEDARRLGVAVLAPDVNASDVAFIVADGKVLFGLSAIKGVGRGTAEEIVRARQKDGPFRDLFDLCERIDHKIVTRAALERLIKAGALDCFGIHRAQLMHLLPRALQAASAVQEDRRLGQLSLFDAGAGSLTESAAPVEALADVPEWSDAEKLKYEKEALDFYFSSHPLAQHEDVLRRFATHTVEQVFDLGPNQEVILGGMLTGLRYSNTKTARNGNTRYLRCKLEDFTGAIECVMWPDDLARCREELREEHPYFVKGVVERTREQPGLILTRIMGLEQAQRELARSLWLQLTVGRHSPHHIEAIAQVLRRSPGSCRVRLHVRDLANRGCVLELGREYSIDPARVAIAELEEIVGPGCVKFGRGGNGRNGR
ncbi:MAG TPA: DNA polymerase III subunit alpha [Gemmataceae bacterium]|nr:DNA polymerase III subunit alpha [Gemmataceae bacterium]